MPTVTRLFASSRDLEPVLRSLEEGFQLKYVLRDFGPKNEPVVYGSAFDIPGLGLSATGNGALNAQYLVMDSSTPIRLREVPQRRGGIYYAVDELRNDCMVASFGGLFSDRALIASEIYGMQSSFSKELFKRCTREIKRTFTRCQEFYVGPEALEMSRRGIRLTQGAGRPIEYDLVVE